MTDPKESQPVDTTNEIGLRSIVQSMSEGVIAVSQEGRVLIVNDSAQGILGFEDGIEGKLLTTIETDTDLAGFVEQCLESLEPIQEEIVIDQHSRRLVIEVTVAPLRNAEGGLAGAVIVLHDVTGMRLAQKMRRDFVANVSHELKTPLTAIQGATMTIIDSENMPPETQARFLDNIKRNADRLEQLITDIMELSRIQQGADQLELERLDLRRTVSDVVSRLREAAIEKGNELTYDGQGPALPIDADRPAIVSVIENLVSNAIRYTPPGGWIEVRVGKAGERVFIDVRDSGIGIDQKMRDRIFERFYRIDKARSRSLGGTGLGLAIVKNYVQAHGGEVTVNSDVGKGSTFRVELPTRVTLPNTE